MKPAAAAHAHAASKGLAASIVVAATLAAWPKALLGAVAAYLGTAKSAIAAAFIGKVLDDTGDAISEKLCKAIRLC